MISRQNTGPVQEFKVHALLPMKGHSERVPDKNMRDFAGCPLYHAIVDELLKSKYIDIIIIDTDSERIKYDVLNCYNNRVIILDRPEQLCGDFVSMNDIINFDIGLFDNSYFLQTHSTNPLLTYQTIDEGILCYMQNLYKYDSLFSVTRLQTRLYDKQVCPVNHNPDELIRTQDLNPLFEENSNFYIFSKESFKKAGNNRIGLNPQMFEMNKLESIDIDEMEDFELAELLYKKRRCLL